MASKEIELQYSSPENAPVSKKGYFVSPIDKGWVEARNKTAKLIGNLNYVGSMTTLGVVSVVFMAYIPSLPHNMDIPTELLMSMGGWLSAGLSGSFFPFMSKKKRNKEAAQYAARVTAKLIQDWLLKKYNLTVDESNAEQLASYVSGLGNVLRVNDHFYDSKGDYYRLGSVSVNGVEEYFVILEKLGDSDANALKPKLDALTIDAEAVANASQEEPKFAFNGEAKILHASIVARIQKLSTMDVDADKQYTLNFVAEELADVIEIQKKASSLDSTESIQSHIVAVLSDLNDELDKLIISELAEFERQLSVKRNHLAERKMGSNSSVKAIESLSEKDSTHV